MNFVKNFLMRVLYKLIAQPRVTLIDYGGIELRKGKIPSKLSLEIWDYYHNGSRSIQVGVYYTEDQTHTFTKFNTLPEALRAMALIEPLLGKRI